jgi:hypothetical protein
VQKLLWKNFDFLTFREKLTLDPSGGRVNIMADGNFLATYLKIGVDYEFDIKNNIWDIADSKTCGYYKNSLLSIKP